MEYKEGQGYVYAVIMGLLTTIICLVIAIAMIVPIASTAAPQERSGCPSNRENWPN